MNAKHLPFTLLLASALLLGACAGSAADDPSSATEGLVSESSTAEDAPSLPQEDQLAEGPAPPPPGREPEGAQPAQAAYSMQQTLSDNAQTMTIAFDALAFLTGDLGSDSFFPPGKVADFWGFQYLRDNDPSEMGHNTDFLTSAALNVLTILDDEQFAQLASLAESQVDDINEYAYQRFVLMTAFRRLLEGDLPAGTTGLDSEAIQNFSAELYRLDGEISFERAEVMGGIVFGLSEGQRAYLDAMVGQGMASWPEVNEPDTLRELGRDEKIAVMTYAADIFSWYAGSLEADVYFCPERQGTYFGSFYMKDAPAVGNPDYTIGTNITGDMGLAFLETLSEEQASLVVDLVEIQRPYLYGIVDLREDVAVELRKFMVGESADYDLVMSLMDEYGRLDGMIIYYYATNFAQVGQTLTADQLEALMELRSLTLGDFTPEAAFLYAEPIGFPTITDTDFLFQ